MLNFIRLWSWRTWHSPLRLTLLFILLVAGWAIYNFLDRAGVFIFLRARRRLAENQRRVMRGECKF